MRGICESGETSVRYYQNQKATHTLCIPKSLQMSFQLLLDITTMCTSIYTYHTVMFKKNKRIPTVLIRQQEAHGQTCFFYRHYIWEFPGEPCKKAKPTRHHHVLFFCAKSPTDNSCIESYARRNSKNLCISKSLVPSHSTSKLSPVSCLTTYLSEGCQSGYENIRKLWILTPLIYFFK